MTARQVFEGLLIELSKVNAPSMLLSDFNYFFNKSINQYVNKRYNIYDVNQQTSDDLRVLKSTAILKPELTDKYSKLQGSSTLGGSYPLLNNVFGATYEVNLPDDYLHLLNCTCVYKVNKQFKCYSKGSFVSFAARRLTADSWSKVMNDFYNRPTPERPYFYIHNVNDSVNLPTNSDTDNPNEYNVYTRDGQEHDENSNLPRTVDLANINNASLIEKPIAIRHSNPSKVRCEIRYGKDNTVFELVEVLIDYVKSPQHIRLTQEQVDLTEDTSQMMEFPDYVCQEIINELVHIVMETTADPRLQTHVPISQSIAMPTQQQPQR